MRHIRFVTVNLLLFIVTIFLFVYIWIVKFNSYVLMELSLLHGTDQEQDETNINDEQLL